MADAESTNEADFTAATASGALRNLDLQDNAISADVPSLVILTNHHRTAGLSASSPSAWGYATTTATTR